MVSHATPTRNTGKSRTVTDDVRRTSLASKVHRAAKLTDFLMFSTRAGMAMRLLKKICGALCAVSISIAVPAAQSLSPSVMADAGYRLGPRDGLSIVVYGHDELSGK